MITLLIEVLARGRVIPYNFRGTESLEGFNFYSFRQL